MYYHFKIHADADGLWAQCIELPGCVTQADSREELALNMQEALNVYLDEDIESNDRINLPDTSIQISESIVAVPVDMQIAFAFLVRYWRLQHGMTQKEAATQMGFDTLYSYQRLESKKCNPSLKIISKIKSLYPELSIDSIVPTHPKQQL